MLLQSSAGQIHGVPLKGAQEGLVLTVTPQDYIVHWPNSTLEANSTQPINSTEILPYQEGETIDENTEVNYGEDDLSCEAINTQEVLMI